MQRMLDIFSETANKIGFQINTAKTEIMYQLSPDNTTPVEPTITINGEVLKVVQNLKYLGSTLSSDNTADKELSCRIQSACASFGKLEKRLWKKNDVRLSTKCRVYKELVLPALLYCSEPYPLYR